MKKFKKYVCFLLVLAFITTPMLTTITTATEKPVPLYLVMIQSKNGTWKCYDNLAFKNKNNQLVLNAKYTANKLGFQYKKIDNKKFQIVRSSNWYTAYTTTKKTSTRNKNGVKKEYTLTQKPYFENSIPYVPVKAFSSLCNYKYFSGDKLEAHVSMIYDGIICYSKYNKITEMPSLTEDDIRKATIVGNSKYPKSSDKEFINKQSERAQEYINEGLVSVSVYKKMLNLDPTTCNTASYGKTSKTGMLDGTSEYCRAVQAIKESVSVKYTGSNTLSQGRIGKVAWKDGKGVCIQNCVVKNMYGITKSYDGWVEDVAYMINEAIDTYNIPDASKMSQKECMDWLVDNAGTYKTLVSQHLGISHAIYPIVMKAYSDSKAVDTYGRWTKDSGTLVNLVEANWKNGGTVIRY